MGFKRVVVQQGKFGIKLAAVARAQAHGSHGGDSFSTQRAKVMLSKTRCAAGRTKMIGGSIRASAGKIGVKNNSGRVSREPRTPKKRRPASDGFRAEYLLFCDGAHR